MKLIVGLGNPGPEYAKTRHNAGFLAIDRLADRLCADPSGKAKFHSLAIETRISTPDGAEKAVLLKPMTFMNKSGVAVAEAVSFYKLDPAKDLVVLVDDLALPCGTIRLRGEGSPGGHNGLIDIENRLGTRKYPRLRLGIDPKGRGSQVDYVLGRFTPEQWDQMDLAFDKTVDAVLSWTRDGLAKAMSLHNAKGG